MTGQTALGSPARDGALAGSRILLISAFALALVWWGVLAALTYYTANPVTLNREQILRSALVVTGTIVGDPGEGRVTVEREWKKSPVKKETSETILVSNLTEAGARRGLSYLMPLSRGSDGFHVTPTLLPNAAPLIYPATPDAIKQLEAILHDKDEDAKPTH